MRAIRSNLIWGAYRMDCYQMFDLAAKGWLNVRPTAFLLLAQPHTILGLQRLLYCRRGLEQGQGNTQGQADSIGRTADSNKLKWGLKVDVKPLTPTSPPQHALPSGGFSEQSIRACCVCGTERQETAGSEGVTTTMQSWGGEKCLSSFLNELPLVSLCPIHSRDGWWSHRLNKLRGQ